MGAESDAPPGAVKVDSGFYCQGTRHSRKVLWHKLAGEVSEGKDSCGEDTFVLLANHLATSTSPEPTY